MRASLGNHSQEKTNATESERCLERWVEGREGRNVGAWWGAESDSVFIYDPLRECSGNKSRGTDCGRACGMFFNGVVGAARWCQSDSGKHFDQRNAYARQAGFGMDDHREPH